MNPFRHLLRSAGSQPPIGTWIMSASPLVAEAVGHAGFDWGLIDMEHAPVDMMDVLHMLQAVGNTKMVPVLRVPWNDAVVVKRVLDAGAQTVLFPFVQDAGEAARADGLAGAILGNYHDAEFGDIPKGQACEMALATAQLMGIGN